MMISGSMDRALTTKTVSPLTSRQLYQWTAATSLVAVGVLALFSAHTMEKLSQHGRVKVDVQAFRKMASTSLAFDRLDDQKILLEEDRLIQKAAFAQADALPEANLAFRTITKTFRSNAKKRPISRLVKARVGSIASTPILSAQDAWEIAQLETVTDPAVEARSIASVYQRIRFQFIAAADLVPNAAIALSRSSPSESAELATYSEESIAIAQNSESYEFDEIPTFDGSDFLLVPAPASIALADEDTLPVIESAPSILGDAITTAASSRVTANPEIISGRRNEMPSFHHEKDPVSKTVSMNVITSTGLDGVPAESEMALSTQPEKPLSTQAIPTKEATGPPLVGDLHKIIESTPPMAKDLEQNDLPFETAPIVSSAVSPPTETSSSLALNDQHEYSADVASIYDLGEDDESDYSKEVASGRASEGRAPLEYSHESNHLTDLDSIPAAKQKETAHAKRDAVKNNFPAKETSLGNGVTADPKGVTIAWGNSSRSTERDSSLGGKIRISRPDAPQMRGALRLDKTPEVKQSLGKFQIGKTSVSIASDKVTATESAVTLMVAEPSLSAAAVDLKSCETSRVGVEAFAPGAEKESLSICARALSHEGLNEGTQARWWETYGTESEHWPTLIYQKTLGAAEADRVPMISTASIRILSAVSRSNTHSGMGILFGEIPKGQEIQLMGRADAPIYLDTGMKQRDVNSDPTGKRQFVFLNVEPGQLLLYVKDIENNLAGSIPLIVKPGIATYIKVPKATAKDVSFVVLDASVRTQTRLANLTGAIIGQAAKMGITDRAGVLKISKLVTFGDYPTYVDVLQSERGYKNRYRVRFKDRDPKSGLIPLYFFNEKRVSAWLKQLAGGVSPFSGIVVGALPAEALSKGKAASRSLRIGTFEKKSSLVPERYTLDREDQLISEPTLQSGNTQFIGVQIPEGATIPSLIDEKGGLIWSELIYSQPGVINVVGP